MNESSLAQRNTPQTVTRSHLKAISGKRRLTYCCSRPFTAVPASPFSGSVATTSASCLILPEPQLQLLFSPCSSQGLAPAISLLALVALVPPFAAFLLPPAPASGLASGAVVLLGLGSAPSTSTGPLTPGTAPGPSAPLVSYALAPLDHLSWPSDPKLTKADHTALLSYRKCTC
ncbi:hypothetical protein MHYP_G00298390 [Metynnis hypsauchen]